MKKFNHVIYVTCIILIVVFTGCATTPSVQIWRPWTRVLNSNTSIPLNSKIKIVVEGDSEPLLSNESLLQDEFQKELKYLLERRGYEIVKDNFEFIIKLKYKTTRYDKIESSSLMYSSNDNSSAMLAASGTLSTFGLGVSIAQTVSALSNKSNSLAQNVSKTVKSYTHTISIEIQNNNDEMIWLGESTWDSPNINLQTDIKPSIQIIVSNLPENKENLPLIPKVKKEKAKNYYNLVCRDKWFSCPAVPYKITFSPYINSQHNVYGLPFSINDPSALAAYVDLMQTAEYVLPVGKENYDNPLEKSLWNKIQLGGIYKLSDKEQIKILIKLKGVKSGYLVDKCWIATDEEFTKFEKNLENWRNSLIDYYDVYEE